MSLHWLGAHRCAIFVEPAHKLIYILDFLVLERVEYLSSPFPPHPLQVFLSHFLFGREESFAGQDGSDRNSLEFEQGECSGKVRDADEDESWVGDVKDVFVEVVDLGAVGDEDGIVCFMDGGVVAVIVFQKWKGDVVSSTNDDAVNLSNFLTIFEIYPPWDWIVLIC